MLAVSSLSKVTYFNLPQLHLAPLLEVTPFAKIFGIRKLESLGYRAALFPWFNI